MLTVPFLARFYLSSSCRASAIGEPDTQYGRSGFEYTFGWRLYFLFPFPMLSLNSHLVKLALASRSRAPPSVGGNLEVGLKG
jgi:hypothetical protein